MAPCAEDRKRAQENNLEESKNDQGQDNHCGSEPDSFYSDNVQSSTRRSTMLRGLKKPQIFLALIISLSVPILSSYLIYCDIAEDDRFDSEAQDENEDLDDVFMAPDCQNQLTFFGSIGSNALFPVFLPETNAIEQVSPFCSLSSCLEQKTLVLRC